MIASRTKSVGLGLTVIIVNVLLVALVAIGMSQRGFSGWWQTLRGEWVPLDDALDVDDPLADRSTATTPPPDDGQATTEPPPEMAETTEEPEPEGPSVEERYAEGEDITVLVLGDRTGVHANDWPAAWGRMLATDRTVEIFSPLASDPTRYGEPLELGGGDATVSIYNASYIDGTPSYSAERLPLLGAESPDVVLLNYGRSNTPEDLPEGLDALWAAVEDEFPDTEPYVVVAPPRLDGQNPTVDVTREWAEETDAPLIDVAELFEDEGIVALTQSGRDPLAVNIYGNEVWAQEVHREVLGSEPPSPEPAPNAAPPTEPAVQEPAEVEPPSQAAAETAPPAEPQPPVDEPAAPQPSQWAYIPPPAPQPSPAPYVPPYEPPAEPTVDPSPTSTAVPAPAPAPAPPDPDPTEPEPTDPPDGTEPAPTDPPEAGTDRSRSAQTEA